MKRRKFMLSTALVGSSTILLGANISGVLHDAAHWNYPASLSVLEIEHIDEMANSLVPHMPDEVKNKKKFVRNMLEPQRVLTRTTDENGYRTTFINKNGQEVLIYQKAGKSFTKFVKN